MNRRSAFTLIELLVVVAIITLLVAILVPALGMAKRISMQTKCGAQLKGIGTAMSAFNADYDRIPIGGRGVNGYGLSPTNAELAGAISTTNGIRTMFSNTWYPSLVAPSSVSLTNPETSNAVDIGNPADGRWTGLPNALSNYMGGGNKAASFVCPATSSINPFNFFWNIDTSTNVIGHGTRYPIWYSNYECFMGDPGNNCTTIAGLNTFYTQVDSSYNITTTTYDNLAIPVKTASLLPTMLLMQDAQYIDSSGVAYGNHPTSSATLMPDSYPANGGGTFYTSAYYTGNRITNFSGSNALYGDFHVDFIQTNNLTAVSASTSGSQDKVLFLGSQNYH